MIFSMFVLVSLALLCVGFWNLTQIYMRVFQLREKEIQSKFMARTGLEEYIYAIRNGKQNAVDLAPDWQPVSGNMYTRSTYLSNPITYFDYDGDVYVNVSGNKGAVIDVSSFAKILEPARNMEYVSTINAKLVIAETGDVHILELVGK